MKISDVKAFMVLGTAWRNLTYVEVHTDDGLVGVGEVRMLNHTDALIGYFAEAGPNHILGSDPFNIEDLVQRMFRNDCARAADRHVGDQHGGDGVLGHRRQGAQPARLSAPGRRRARAHQGLRERLVHGGANAESSTRPRSGLWPGLSGREARSLRCWLLRARAGRAIASIELVRSGGARAVGAPTRRNP